MTVHELNIAAENSAINTGLHTEGGGGALGFPSSSLSPPLRIRSESNLEYKIFSGGACYRTPKGSTNVWYYISPT